MMEVFLVQLLAAGLGGSSTALADRAYDRARINQRVHSMWVAGSIAVICLPVLVWTCNIFLGPSIAGRAVAGFVMIMLFLRVYWSLQRLPAPSSAAGHPVASGSANPAARRGRLTS